MLGWMAYVLVVGLLLAAAALAGERAAQLHGGSSRWVWLVAILASLFLPSVIASVSVQAPPLHPSAQDGGQLVALRQLTSSVLQPSAWLVAAGGPATGSPSLDRLLQLAWLAGSAVLLISLLLSAGGLYRLRRGWDQAIIAGERVYISKDVGPAVVGLLRPQIVLPQWLAAAPADLQQMVVAHERAHLRAGDARLLAIGLLLVVAMPWNIALWWQLRRLRFAIEMDCDARVLAAGGDVSAYGGALVAVGERGSARIAVVAGMAESKTFLEKRVRKMLSKRARFAWAAASGLAGLGVVLAASAAQVSPPNAVAAAGRNQVTINPERLEAYAGYYLMGEKAVLSVRREGDHLSIQLTGQPAAPVFSRSQTQFLATIVKAQFDFEIDPSGKVTGVVLHQNGQAITLPRIDAAKAQNLIARTEARVKAQAASRGTEAAARRLDRETATGKPPYDAMTAELASVMRPQVARIQAYLAGLGPIEVVRFVGVNPEGADVYNIRHANGIARWTIALDAEGKIAGAFVTPGP